MIGLINGSFYAMLSLGMAIVFGLLHVVNFAHGAIYMVGGFLAYLLMQYAGLNYWAALICVPLIVAPLAMLLERGLLNRIKALDPIYGFLLTFGITLVIEGMFRYWFGSSNRQYPTPELLRGVTILFGVPLPIYRIWIVVVSLVICLGTWFVIERSRLGGYLRAATENPKLVEVFGLNVPLMITLTFGGAAALAALTGVLAAPVFQVSPQMGAGLVVIVFAVVVVGGMGSIKGAIIAGYAFGVIEGITKVIYPEGSYAVIFIVMALVLLFRPNSKMLREG